MTRVEPQMWLTDETLERMQRAPSRYAAWVLRAAIEELIWYRQQTVDSPKAEAVPLVNVIQPKR